MLLEGSCHCGAVSYAVEAHEPVPYLRCYCSICRKTAGTGGYAINLGADKRTLKVRGAEHLSIYRATLDNGETSSGQRHFCSRCGTALWLYDPRWPELVHPHAGAVDTPLGRPPDATHMMLAFKPGWVDAHVRPADDTFDEHPKETLAEWHRRHRLGG
ncbi:MAG TPA: GFA family protein [Burkholderiaceae bacterium]|jgi:hypothetical protein|nr:GFA family protein [Burkholderiaceae bacterium]